MALATALFGCGQTSHGKPQASGQQLACGDDGEVVALGRVAGATQGFQLGPCGELAYREADQLLLTDASLQNPQVLDGASDSPLRFDPWGRGVLYQRTTDGNRELVHLGLHDGPTWTAPLAPSPSAVPALFDFYPHAGDQIAFACQGSSLHVYPGGPEHERVTQLNTSCFGGFYSAADGFLVSFSSPMTGVDIHSGRETPLPHASACGADLCTTELIGRVLEVERCNQMPIGDTFVCSGPPPSHYDARSDALLAEPPLIKPDRSITSAGSGRLVYQATDLTSALTADANYAAEQTLERYYGPDPRQPERWLETSAKIATSAELLPIFSDDFAHIALRTTSCNGYPPDPVARAWLFSPGTGVDPIEVPGCLQQVYWVGRDGTLLANLIPTVSTTGAYEERLILIHPDHRITQLDVRPQDIRNTVSDGVTLATPFFGDRKGLLLIDLATGQTELRDVEPMSDLAVDRSRKRLAFEARIAGDPPQFQLWAGAFPGVATVP